MSDLSVLFSRELEKMKSVFYLVLFERALLLHVWTVFPCQHGFHVRHRNCETTTEFKYTVQHKPVTLSDFILTHSYRWAARMALHPAETRPDLRSEGPCDSTTGGRTRTSLWEEPKPRSLDKLITWLMSADVRLRHLVSVYCRVCGSSFPHTGGWVAAVWSAPESPAGSAHGALWRSTENTCKISWISILQMVLSLLEQFGAVILLSSLYSLFSGSSVQVKWRRAAVMMEMSGSNLYILYAVEAFLTHKKNIMLW